MYSLTSAGTHPIKLDVAKAHLKVETPEDDALITNLLSTVLAYAESETGRDYRANTWTLLVDEFKDRICLRKSPIASITSIKYTVTTTHDTTIATSVYYLKKGRQFSEILLQADQTWPTDLAEVEHGIEIVFATVADRNLERAKAAMLKHLAHLYQNRGDCDPVDSAMKSGAKALYDQPGMKIARV